MTKIIQKNAVKFKNPSTININPQMADSATAGGGGRHRLSPGPPRPGRGGQGAPGAAALGAGGGQLCQRRGKEDGGGETRKP